MKKLLNILLVRRSETKNKWWNRLALVLIYGSTLIILVFFVILLFAKSGDYWVTKSYTAYNFEQGYKLARGEETDCKFSISSLDGLPPLPIFNCGDLSSYNNTPTSASKFLEKYSRAHGTYKKLQELRKNESNNEIMITLIKGGELNDVKVKRITSFDYASFLKDWGTLFLLAPIWFIFWESITYRTILFIVYGKKKDK